MEKANTLSVQGARSGAVRGSPRSEFSREGGDGDAHVSVTCT